MAKIEFTPKGVCSSKIIVSCDENDVIKDVKFIGGCPGNTMGVSILCKGKTIDEVINMYSSSVMRVLTTRLRCGVLYRFRMVKPPFCAWCPLTNRRKTGCEAELF